MCVSFGGEALHGLTPCGRPESRQRLEVLEGVERERERLDTTLAEERDIRSTVDEKAKASREVGRWAG